MQSEFERMLEDIINVAGYYIVEFTSDDHIKWIHVWESKDILFVTYRSDSFTGALKKAWQKLCG